MSLDLKLYYCLAPTGIRPSLTSILTVFRDGFGHDLRKRFRTLAKKIPLPLVFSSDTEDVEISKCPHGHLTYVLPEAFEGIKAEHPANQAIVDYILTHPDRRSSIVALYWH